MEYVRVCGSLSNGKPDGGKLVPIDYDVYDIVTKNPKVPYYKSTFIYNDNHYNIFKEKGSIAGITDVVTDRLYWDFDSKTDLERARKDAVEMCSRLQSHGIPADNIQICFSGYKGFSVEITTDQRFLPEQVQTIALKMAEGLDTFDNSMYNASRVFRIPGTVHHETKLYKLPLTLEQLSEYQSVDIQEFAKDIDNSEVDDSTWQPVSLPQSIIGLKSAEKKDPVTNPVTENAADLDFKFKPKGFTNCKFAILNGFFPNGNRNNSLTALAATCRALYYPKEVAYNMLKAAARLQTQRYDSDSFPKAEMWSIVDRMYSEKWEVRGQYSCKTQPFLKDICDSLGHNRCKHEDDGENVFIETGDMASHFEEYSLNIEKNTIKTGLKELDENIQLTVGMPVALLGAPSSGKTTIALNILNNTSNMDIRSIFFSMDMYGPLVYMKQIQKLEGIGPKQIHEIFKHDPKRKAEIQAKIKEEYKNVRFSLKAGHSVQEMRDMINRYQDQTGDKVKLVLIDYLECIAGPYSDPTANSSKIAGELRDFATEMAVCGITLVQPPKSAGDASYPLTSMRQIKGSSMLEQSFRAILGVYREGFGPNNAERDKFMTINALKNTMGPLFSIDYSWSGKKGEVFPLSEEEEMDLRNLRSEKEKKQSNDGGW